MKRIFTTVASLAVGGFIGCEYQARWKEKSVQAAAPLFPHRPTEIMKYGFPSSTNIKMRENYVLSYDRRSRNAHWVFEHLTKELLQKTDASCERVECQFVADNTVPEKFQSTNDDYYRSGFDRGHLAAAANHKAYRQWMSDTFFMSNISPQNPHLNRNAWNNLEKYTRSLVRHYDNVYVCTGPLYLPKREADGKLYIRYQVLEPNHVAVPTHFFKVILSEKMGEFDIRCYMMPNEPVDPDVPLHQFMIPIDAIEKASGLEIFSHIDPRRVRRYNNGIESRM